MSDVELVKVVVDIPEGNLGVYGEGLWAKPLGNELYEIHNSPWHSREINYLDIVQARAPTEDKKPVVVSVKKRQGHRTIQIILLDKSVPKKNEVLGRLNALGATYENANGSLFALDFAPDVDWDPAKTYLAELTQSGWLEYRWSAY